MMIITIIKITAPKIVLNEACSFHSASGLSLGGVTARDIHVNCLFVPMSCFVKSFKGYCRLRFSIMDLHGLCVGLILF